MNTTSNVTPEDLILTGLVTNAGRSYTSLNPDELIAHFTVKWAREGWEGIEFSYTVPYVINPDHIAADSIFTVQARDSQDALATRLTQLFSDDQILTRLGLYNAGQDMAALQVRVVHVWSYDRTESYQPPMSVGAGVPADAAT